jgi:MYXO-CTERM domain-containing protein
MSQRALRFGILILATGAVLNGFGQAHGGTIPVPHDMPGTYQVMRAVAAKIFQGEQELVAPSVLYDGTGLTHSNPVLASHGNDPATIWQYSVVPADYPVSVEFDLGGLYLVNELWIWQLQGELEDRGLQEFDIVMRDEAHRLVGDIEGRLDDIRRVGVQPVQRFNAFGECIFLPVPDCVRYVELRVNRNKGNEEWLGLAEVAFAGWQLGCQPVPEPQSWSLGAFGLGHLMAGRRRRRRPIQSIA